MKLTKMITLLTVVTLFAGCNMAHGPEKPVLNSGEKIAEVLVTIDGNARTLLPDLNFSKYILSAEPAEGNAATPPSPVQINVFPGSGAGVYYSRRLLLSYGEWIITVTAYVNVGGIDYAAAKGSVPLTVSNSSHSITVPVNTPQPGGMGTFTYTVRYPSAGTASVKLEPWPLGQPELFDEAANNGVQTFKSVPSGIYFLTVSATVNSKTVTRNEIVHIYQQSTTNAEYIFTKADFEGNLNLSGTIKVLVSGEQPDQAYVYIGVLRDGSRWYYYIPINFTGTDGSGTWNISFDNSGLLGVNTLSFRAGFSYYRAKELLSIPVPVDDMSIDLGTVAWNMSPLPIDTWVDGNVTSSNAEDWYSINVTAGETYYFWFNNGYNNGGDGTKTLEGYFGAFYSNGYGDIFGNSEAWNDPTIFTVNDSGTVYIRVNGNGNTGTYAIAYSTNSHWHNNSFPPANAVPLPADIWVDGNITPYDAADWYSINVIAGETYYFWFNNYYGDGTKTLEGYFGAYYSNGYRFFGGYSNAWNTPQSFTANASGTVYISVTRNGIPGTYAIAYSTEMFSSLNPVNFVPLTADVWVDGEITSYGDADWYSINVIAGETYYFWFNNRYQGDGTKTLNGYFLAYYSNGDHIFFPGGGWNDPAIFTANSNGTVYIRVSDNYGNTGTYAIGYSTNSHWWHNNSGIIGPTAQVAVFFGQAVRNLLSEIAVITANGVSLPANQYNYVPVGATVTINITLPATGTGSDYFYYASNIAFDYGTAVDFAPTSGGASPGSTNGPWVWTYTVSTSDVSIWIGFRQPPSPPPDWLEPGAKLVYDNGVLLAGYGDDHWAMAGDLSYLYGFQEWNSDYEDGNIDVVPGVDLMFVDPVNNRKVMRLAPSHLKWSWCGAVFFLEEAYAVAPFINNIVANAYNLVFEHMGGAIDLRVDGVNTTLVANGGSQPNLPAQDTWATRTISLGDSQDRVRQVIFYAAGANEPIYIDRIRFVPKE